MYELEDNVTERLEVRQKMCKTLMKCCAGPGYNADIPTAMINWNPAKWDQLMKNLSDIVGTAEPFEDEILKNLYCSCAANRSLADYRKTLEDDIREGRDSVSIPAEQQAIIK